jgi:hypothetical protein
MHTHLKADLVCSSCRPFIMRRSFDHNQEIQTTLRDEQRALAQVLVPVLAPVGRLAPVRVLASRPSTMSTVVARPGPSVAPSSSPGGDPSSTSRSSPSSSDSPSIVPSAPSAYASAGPSAVPSAARSTHSEGDTICESCHDC